MSIFDSRINCSSEKQENRPNPLPEAEKIADNLSRAIEYIYQTDLSSVSRVRIVKEIIIDNLINFLANS
jgi:phosphoenolpyruvate carboxylase